MNYLTKFNQRDSNRNFWYSDFYKVLFWILISLFTMPLFAQEAKKEELVKEVTEKKKADKDVVSGLTAILSSDLISVELKWNPPADEGDIIIARSNQVIDTMEKLGVADSLGKFKSDRVNIINSHKDINLRPGEYYYAIVLVSQVKKRKVKLYPEVNYTILPVVVPVKPNTAPILPQITEIKPETDSISNLKVRKVDKSVRLTWTPPLEAEKNIPKYTIYRSLEPMSNTGLMEKAIKIGEVIHPETTFLDMSLDSTQTVYYGVAVSIGEKETTPLVEDKSYRKFYFVKSGKPENEPDEITVVEEKKEPAAVEIKSLQINNLLGEVRKDGVLLAWTAPEGAVNNYTTYYIYESTEPMINESGLMIKEKVKKVGTVVHPEKSFLHPNLDRHTLIFYAVTTKAGDGQENIILKEGQSYIKIEPEVVNKKKKAKKKKEEIKVEEKSNPVKPVPITEEVNPDFDTIMTQYYKKEKFREAMVKFKSLADRVSDDSLRGKSLFFAAMCHYNLREYDFALKILLKEEVQMNYDKERVDFYVKRCLENRGNK